MSDTAIRILSEKIEQLEAELSACKMRLALQDPIFNHVEVQQAMTDGWPIHIGASKEDIDLLLKLDAANGLYCIFRYNNLSL
jgi:hypothetical protein